MTATARAFRHPRSPLERANDRLLLWLIVLAVPLAIGLTVSVLARPESANARVQAITAGIVNLVPEGLILLISVTAAVSAFKLAKRGVLAQQLNAIESLASVDIVCTDKTGTLTEPTLRVIGVLPAPGEDETSVARELTSYATSAPSRNLTRTPSWRMSRGAASSLRCHSPPDVAGARLIWATSGSCWVRRSGSPTPIRHSARGRVRRRAPGDACWRLAAAS
jgi:magnesium-transporting ATPase (P-type)